LVVSFLLSHFPLNLTGSKSSGAGQFLDVRFPLLAQLDVGSNAACGVRRGFDSGGAQPLQRALIALLAPPLSIRQAVRQALEFFQRGKRARAISPASSRTLQGQNSRPIFQPAILSSLKPLLIRVQVSNASSVLFDIE
jgi:hypothetical protein